MSTTSTKMAYRFNGRIPAQAAVARRRKIEVKLIKEAGNTISASWLTLKLAKLFGRKILRAEMGRVYQLREWRGKVYLIGEMKLKNK